jgi:hypothetical protein
LIRIGTLRGKYWKIYQIAIWGKSEIIQPGIGSNKERHGGRILNEASRATRRRKRGLGNIR